MSEGRLVSFLTAPVEDQDGLQTPTSAAAVAPQTPTGAAAYPPGDIRRYFRVVSATAERPVWTRTRSDVTAQWTPRIRLCCRVRERCPREQKTRTGPHNPCNRMLTPTDTTSPCGVRPSRACEPG